MKQPYSLYLSTENKFQYALAAFCLVVFAGPLFFPLTDKDAAHHANIALHMLETNNYAFLVDRGMPYLDKPHFLFWSSALSFKIFGVNTFAHRFPAMVFALISVYSTYKLTRHLTDKPTAKLAAAMLATAQAFILSISDARMETPLTAAVVFSLWQMILYVDKRKFSNLLLAALGVAIAFSTKGWLGPIVVFISVFFYLLFTKKWQVLAAAKTWLFIPLFVVFISPVLYAYYLQFDLHPETTVRGMNNISGVRFILWGQLFERYKGFDEGGRYSDYFFLYHTFLWAFFPWSIIAVAAIVYWGRRVLFKKNPGQPLSFAAAAFVFILVTVSFSKFKMPHYIIMLLPLAALFTAPYALHVTESLRGRKWFSAIQVFLAAVIIAGIVALNYYFFQPLFGVAIIGSALLLLLLFLIFKTDITAGGKFIYISILLSLVFNFFLFYNFFPQLMKYQGGNELVKMIKQKNLRLPTDSIALIEMHAHSFDFYSRHNHMVAEDFVNNYRSYGNKYFLLTNRIQKDLEANGFIVQPIISHIDYNVNTIKLKFLNPKTRLKQCDELMLAKVYKQ